MASASSSSVEKSYIYDVFMSFRGKDLRTSFVDHLCEGFRRHGIIVFKDNKHIEVGEKISDELPKAIKNSKFHIVIFSKRYADSYWCLNELVEILQSQKPGYPTFYPIFYDVTPSDVREQKGLVEEAFTKHSKNEAAGRWRAAMAEAASLEGLELIKTGDGHEVQFIEKIVHAISQKPYFAELSVNDNLVGMTTRVEKLLLSLQVGFDDVRMLGITGLGGVGKTTLAGVVFNRIANQFDGKIFVQNVRERSEHPSGFQDMQKQILTSVFGDQSIAVPSDFEGRNMMKRRLPSIKVLVVLDDVNDPKQLEALAEPSWFRPGSRIIITSRDRQVLVAHGVESRNIHDVSTLSDEDAIRLLSSYAFNMESPAEGYEELSEKVVRYAAGLPLTIKTLGSSLRDCPTDAWENAIKRLKEIPWGDTLKILKISYDALEEDQKDIFLHVACLLKGLGKKRAIIILESLGFHAEFGLGVLEQKSLITLRGYDYDEKGKLLNMHDHIEEMGMHIVRSLHDEPQQRKLLWINDEIEDIIEKDMGTKAIEGIKLQTDLHPVKILRSLRKMSRLCFLHVERPYYYKTSRSYSWVYEYFTSNYHLPNSLQVLHFHRYPYRYLPKTFHGDNLVVMVMRQSNIHQIWKRGEKKVLPKLRLLDLSYSKLKTFDSAGLTPNLEELVLRNCEKLVEVNISAKCSHLKKLYLSECKALEKLTISIKCRHLEELKLRECKSLRELQLHGECSSRLKSLSLSKTKLRCLNLGMAPKLEVLSVEWCKDLEELVMPVECPMLTKLSLCRIDKLRSFNLGMAPNIEVLSVEYCEDLEELVMPVECPMLTKLSLCRIDKLRSFNLGMAPNIEVLSVEYCEDFEVVMPVECPMLTKLYLCRIDKLRSFNLGMAPNIEVLSVEYCEDFEVVMPVECPMLTKLYLCRIDKLRSFNLGMAPNIEVLSVEYCENLEELVMPVECTMLTKLTLSGNNKLRSFNLGLTPNLEVLSLRSCQKIFVPVELPRLRDLSVLNYHNDEHYNWSFSYLLDKLKSPLEKLRLSLRSMKRLPVDDSIYMLKHHLRVLDLKECSNLEQLPKDLNRLECLEELILGRCISLRNIPDCICNMTRLRVLDLAKCYNLEELPEDLDRLECLEELLLMDCESLWSIPDCICNMTRLKILDLSFCDQLEKLPDEFRRLQSLQVLNVSGGTADRLKNLQESVSQLKNLKVI